MTSKIFRSTVFVAVVVLLCSVGIVMGVLYNHFTGVLVQQLRAELSLAVTATEQYGNAFLENVEPERFRITWIDTDGTVLFDTQVDQGSMENHGDREEIMEAFQTGSGSAIRSSSTLTTQTFYEARQLKDGTVLRISTSQDSAWALMLDLIWPVILIVLFALLLSGVLSRRMAQNITEPINQIDLEEPLKNNAYEEISPLLQRIHNQNNQIAQQMQTLRRRADEFEQITDNMQEGLILLDSGASILSINPTACRIFQLEESSRGQNFLRVESSKAVFTAVNQALDKGAGYARMDRNGRTFQLDVNRIESNGSVVGAVVLAFDITERLNGEQMRREFSANVSHELKTPLSGIMGSAELLQHGLVQEADMPRFIGHIRNESARLLNLIEDIIRLSQLDEGTELPAEEVNLYTLAQEVVSSLTEKAEEKNVTVTLTGEEYIFTGVRRLLYEVLYNLTENAIKYNKPEGKVQVDIRPGVLTVKDTGIGIPPEHLDRVFERFYRVDKSHSKQSGGTGLGLSIVKHAVSYHGGTIRLDSSPAWGTCITITFPI
ncbi:MAG: PAS domain S-box protein [Agathobacter sp.]|nr:PAS domain S-box protein [Agathobacter sp.]